MYEGNEPKVCQSACTNYQKFGILSVTTVIKICQITVELFLFMGPGQCSMIVKTLLAHDDNISTLQLMHLDKHLRGLICWLK